MRRIAILSSAIFLLSSGTALAVTDTAGLRVAIQTTKLPTPNAPAPLAYLWDQSVGTTPFGLQPDATSSSTIWFAKEIQSNAQHFPSCTQTQLDAAPAIPAVCRPAIVGGGLAAAFAGAPGAPLSASVYEPMTATLLNGSPAGVQWLLYLQSLPRAPVLLNRVLVGTVRPAADPFGFAVRFEIPPDLQSQLGLAIALEHVGVNVPSALHEIVVGGIVKQLSFLEMSACNVSIPALEQIAFAPSGTIVSAGASARCQIGPGFGDYPFVNPPYSYPQYPGYPPPSSGGEGGNAGGGFPPPSPPPPAGLPAGGGGNPVAGGDFGPTPPRLTGPTATKPATLSAGGSFTLPGVTVACPANGGGTCTVNGTSVSAGRTSKVHKAVVLAKVKFSLKAGRSSAVRMKLTKQGKRLFKRTKKALLVTRLCVREANGLQARRTFKTLVKVKKPARHH